MYEEQMKAIALLKVALSTATSCGAIDLLVDNVAHSEAVGKFLDLVQGVAVPDELVKDVARLTKGAPSLANALKSMLAAYNVERACCVVAIDALEQAWPGYQRQQRPLQAWEGFTGEQEMVSSQVTLNAGSA